MLVCSLFKLASSLYSNILSIPLQPKAYLHLACQYLHLYSYFLTSFFLWKVILICLWDSWIKILICREHIASVQKQETESTVSPITINLKIGFLPCSVASSVSKRLSWLRSTSVQHVSNSHLVNMFIKATVLSVVLPTLYNIWITAAVCLCYKYIYAVVFIRKSFITTVA